MATPSLRARARREVRFRRIGFEPLQDRLMLAGDTCRNDEVQAESTVAEVAAERFRPAELFRAADAGSTMGTAYDLGELSAPQLLPGSVGLLDPSDVMRFTLSQTSRVSLGLRGLQADIDLYLYDASGRLLAWSDRVGRASESISATLAAGEYYAVVNPWLGAASLYAFSASARPLVPVPRNPPGDNPANSEPGVSRPPVAPLPEVAYFGGANEWNLNAISAPEAWAAGYTGQGVVVAVVDTGVDVNHPDLMSQLFVNAGEIAGNGIDDDGNGFVDDISGWDFASADNRADDGNGHGTHVAGTIAAANNGTGATGVAPGATILPVRVLNDSGSGTIANVAAGIRYAVDMGANIINLSLGGSYSGLILSAIEYAVSRNVLVVAAAGNEYARAPGYPARFSSSLSSVLSVGAHNSSGAIAGFSNDVGTSGAVQVDAPGVNVYSTYAGGGYRLLSGTSMATPHVAGLAALALSANANLTAAELRSLIVAGTDRAIGGSDSLGGVNAAITVALAAGRQAAGSAGSATSATVSAVARVRSAVAPSTATAITGLGLEPGSTTIDSQPPSPAVRHATPRVEVRVVTNAVMALMETDDSNDWLSITQAATCAAEELEPLFAWLSS